jgi:hypothetical protein
MATGSRPVYAGGLLGNERAMSLTVTESSGPHLDRPLGGPPGGVVLKR